ncbi:hypothetical protein SAMN05661030_3961 [Klenkia taihuensis]|uniref:Uncharacterized protein n=1 Tax=Klenkia taihuensis TaxID=1225127 RepID=A0A1I1U8V6_9ACTN|nr:hypothetical protein SAMN05661030_3961 [Klenkia taihuensis]
MLVTVLREHRIDADADIFHSNDIDIDWTRYGPNAVAAANVVSFSLLAIFLKPCASFL